MLGEYVREPVRAYGNGMHELYDEKVVSILHDRSPSKVMYGTRYVMVLCWCSEVYNNISFPVVLTTSDLLGVTSHDRDFDIAFTDTAYISTSEVSFNTPSREAIP